jgi:CheY-like chemotaxis protein
MKTELALCFYPTVVAFIDDSQSFLSAVELSMSSHFSCITFTDPIRALNHANNLNNVNWNAFANNDYSYASDSEQFIKNTLNLSVNKITDTGRYDEISVVVVDYDMPEMNGLEFCRKLKNPNIKKILLTGQAGFDEAIRAFNDNIINYYIQKSDNNLFENLSRAIQELQNRYFLDISSYIKIRAIDNKRSLFSDAKLSEYFTGLVRQYDIVEYYYLTNPPRYKLKARDGKTSLFLVYSRYELNEQIRVIKEEAGPTWLLDSLKSGFYVPYFKSQDGFYDPESFDAQTVLYPAQAVQGQDTYYCTHITDDSQPLRPDLAPTPSSYH